MHHSPPPSLVYVHPAPQLVQILQFDVHRSSRRLRLRENLPPVERALEGRALEFGQRLGLHLQKVVYNLLLRVGEGFLLDVNGTIGVSSASPRARISILITINATRANYPRGGNSRQD